MATAMVMVVAVLTPLSWYAAEFMVTPCTTWLSGTQHKHFTFIWWFIVILTAVHKRTRHGMENASAHIHTQTRRFHGRNDIRQGSKCFSHSKLQPERYTDERAYTLLAHWCNYGFCWIAWMLAIEHDIPFTSKMHIPIALTFAISRSVSFSFALLLSVMLPFFCRFNEILCDRNNASDTHSLTFKHITSVLMGFTALPHSNCIIEMENLAIAFHLLAAAIMDHNFCPPQW